jgi:hypothetical protein
MCYDRKQSKEPTKPLYDFGGKRIEIVGVITLPVSFGTPQNPRTEYITFDVVDMHYPYNAIFRRGLLNTFDAPLHSGYLASRSQQPSELYSSSALKRTPETLNKASRPATRMCISSEKNQSNISNQHALSMQMLRLNSKKPLMLMAIS